MGTIFRIIQYSEIDPGVIAKTPPKWPENGIATSTKLLKCAVLTLCGTWRSIDKYFTIVSPQCMVATLEYGGETAVTEALRFLKLENSRITPII